MNSLKFSLVVYLFLFSFAIVQISHAQSQSISVTPPLFQLSIKPGDIWQSSVRVVNPNEFPLTVYAEVVNFAPDGEGGQGKFLPVTNTEGTKISLAEWIEVPEGPHVIASGQTRDVTFFVEIPKDAAPGGHFAAILITTEPPTEEKGVIALATTQTVTSLFFVRIEGDIIEKANIREFSVLDRSIELPEAEFSLRFENKGNVHIQPRGNIRITNMWGKERGIIPINNESHFGNVLPESIRDFRFSWKGTRSLADIGRYTAEVSLAYGENGSQSATGEASFWVLPLRGALITLGVIVGILLLVLWMIRLYVRRMLILAGVDPDTKTGEKEKNIPQIRPDSLRRASLPLTEGTRDLSERLQSAHKFIDVCLTLLGFVLHYRRFFIGLFVIVCIFIGTVLYIQKVTTSSSDYEVYINKGDRVERLTDEEIEMQQSEQ